MKPIDFRPDDWGVLIFIIGRPGSGKTTFAHLCISNINDNWPVCKIGYIDEQTLLLNSLKNLRSGQIDWLDSGQFVVNDRTIFDHLIIKLKDIAAEEIKKKDLLLIEYVESDYDDLSDKFSELLVAKFLILYMDASLDKCIERNLNRAQKFPLLSPPSSVIEKYYSKDDCISISDLLKDRLVRIRNNFESVNDLHPQVRSVCKLIQNICQNKS